jgi:hypothetical protein
VFTAAALNVFVSQNAYLYCAAAALNTANIRLVNCSKLDKSMELSEHQKIVYTQVIVRM